MVESGKPRARSSYNKRRRLVRALREAALVLRAVAHALRARALQALARVLREAAPGLRAVPLVLRAVILRAVPLALWAVLMFSPLFSLSAQNAPNEASTEAGNGNNSASGSGRGSELEVYHQEAPVIAGQNFSVFVEIPATYAQGLRFGPIPNPLSTQEQSLRYWAGPSRVSSPNVDTIRYQFLYRANRAGWAELGPFSVIVQSAGISRSIQSDPLLVAITTNGSFIPPLLEWRISAQELYLGQSLYISLDMYRASQIIFPNEITIGEVDNGILQEVTGLGELSSHEFVGRTFNRVPVATFLYTPLLVGERVIPPAIAQFGGQIGEQAGGQSNGQPDGQPNDQFGGQPSSIEREAGAQSISVLPLPVALESAAIGNFRLELSELRESYSVNETINFEVAIHGTGNLHILQFPSIAVQGGIIESMEEIDNYSAAESGYSGVAIERYQIRAANAAELVISIGEFGWFDPQRQSAERVEASLINIGINPEALPPQKSFAELLGEYRSLRPNSTNPILLSRGILGRILLLAIPIVSILYLSIAKKWNRSRGLALIAIGVFCLVLLFITRGSAETETATSESALIGDQAQSITQFLRIGDRYNLDLQIASALVAYEDGDLPQSMASMRRALSIAPFNAQLRELVLRLEKEMELVEQHPILQIPHGDWLFVVVLLCLVVISVARGSAQRKSLLAFSVFLMLMSTSLLMLYYYEIENQEAIVPSGGTILKKIPDPSASDWLYLPEGTSVHMGASAQNFVQIRSAKGIVAWVPESNILRLD